MKEYYFIYMIELNSRGTGFDTKTNGVIDMNPVEYIKYYEDKYNHRIQIPFAMPITKQMYEYGEENL